LPGAAQAQRPDTLARRDTLVRAKADSVARADSARAAADTTRPHIPLPGDTAVKLTAADTLKTPLAHAELPVLDDPTGSYRLDSAAILGTGARNLGDLLRRLPGITELSTGWMAVPATAAYLGDAARVRVFIDGLEYSALDPGAGGAIDYSQIPLWPIETVVVERSASEVRVYLNTWRVSRTTPYTRTDISTGDFQTNLYRGFFGRRFSHGEALQLGVQQYGVRPVPGGATSDQLSYMGRLGWGHNAFSVDATVLQVGTHRGASADPFSHDSLQSLRATRRRADLRVGFHQPGDAAWAQAVASTTRLSYGHGAVAGGLLGPGGLPPGAPVDSARAPGDTLVSEAQYLLTGGVSRWGVRLSAAANYIPSFDRGLPPGVDTITPDSTPACCRRHGLLVPSLRASYDWRRIGLSAYAQGKGTDSTSRAEVSGVFTPFSFLRLSAATGRARDARGVGAPLTTPYVRVEGGLRIHDFWLGGGVLSRGAVRLAAPTLVKDSLVDATDGTATASFVSIQGRVWKGIHADIFGLRWNDSTGLYRPQFQATSKLYISTSLLDRFPDNSFHVYLALTHEYGSARYFPTAGGPVRGTIGYRRFGAQVEIRIERAVISYSITNALGEEYNSVPGYLMPRRASVYGVRWEFWN
jgi:hypothetical protein